MRTRGYRQAARVWRVSAWCALVVASLFCQIATAAPLAGKRGKDKTSETEDPQVPCEGTVVEFEPEYEFCDYPYVRKGAPHSIGRYPGS